MLNLREVLLGVRTSAQQAETLLVPDVLEHVTFSEVVVDSREVTAESLFVALPGERVDGHRFLAAAIAAGARGALVRRELLAELDLDPRVRLIDPVSGEGLADADAQSIFLIAVEDTLLALQRCAAYHRRKFSPIVLGITGSVGKTSTKELTASVLEQRYRTLKNPRSYNTESTLPIVLLQMEKAHEVAILEMGTFGPGEITLLADLALPSIGIVTNVGASHLERMGSVEVIAQAKSELVQALPDTGFAILNIDDERVAGMAAKTSAKPFFYGLNPKADLWADAVQTHGLDGISFTAHYGEQSHHIQLPLLGAHSVYTALAAISAGLVLGMDWDAIKQGLGDRSSGVRLVAVPGQNGATLIDDTYNASPTSSLAALNLLAELDGRRIAVFGDMLELGAYEEEAHRIVGQRVAEVAQLLIVLGTRARWIADEAAVCGMPAEQIVIAENKDAVISLLKQTVQQGDYVLLKGSRGIALEHVVAALRQTSNES